jgi:hypothetical protein
MKESDWRYIVDALLFVCLAGMTFIGVLLGLVIPAGPAAAETAKYFLGLHRHQWGDIHAYLSIAFVALMVVHLVLSWKWIKAKTRQIFKRGATPALVSIAAIPFGFLLLFWAITPKDVDMYHSYGVGAGDGQRIRWAEPREAPQSEDDARQGDIRAPAEPVAPTVVQERFREEEHHTRADSITITGRHTFRDLENATAIPASEIVKRMGLPEETSLDETLGRLRRLYGFEIHEVRDLVARLLKEKDARPD